MTSQMLWTIVAILAGLPIFGFMRLRLRGDDRDSLEDIRAGLTRPNPSAPRLTPAEVEVQARRLVESRRKIDAIKLVRDATGMGLKEAKDYVDGL